MATLPSVDALDAIGGDGIPAPFKRLVRLERELGLAGTRELLVIAATAVARALGAAIMLASLVVMLAVALVPLVAAHWQHLLSVGVAVFVLAAVTLSWSAHRLRSLDWLRLVLTSLTDDYRWLEAPADMQAEIARRRAAIAQRLDALQRRGPHEWVKAFALSGAGPLTGVRLVLVPVVRSVRRALRLLWAGASGTIALAKPQDLLGSRCPALVVVDVQRVAQERNRLRRVS